MLRLFLNAVLIDGVSDEARNNAYLVVDSGDGTIVKVGQGTPDEWMQRVNPESISNLEGAWVVPGLIDCHVHCMRDGSSDPDSVIRTEPVEMVALRVLRNAQRHLEVGITTVRDNGSPGLSAIAAKRAIDMGLFQGPFMMVSGQPLIMTGGHFRTGGKEVDGADEVRKGARWVLKTGSDFVKLLATGGIYAPGEEPGSAQLTVEEMRAAVEEAHKKNRKAVAHAEGLQGIRNALEAGVDTIEHACYADEACLQRFVEQGTYMIPTMNTMVVLADGERLGVPSYAVEKAREVVKVHFPMLQRAVQYGVKIATGTDSGSPGNPPENYFDELEVMHRAGMTKMQVLKASTSVAADALGLTNVVGHLVDGARADFLVLEANPLDELANLKKQRMIIHYGREVKHFVYCR